MSDLSKKDCQVIIPNLNRRFSGITSTVLSVVPEQMKELSFCSVGYPLDSRIPRLSWRELLALTRNPLPNGAKRIFHCRRNIEMCAALVLKYAFGAKICPIFTSTAQRKHTRFTRFLYGKMDAVLSTSNRAASYLARKPDAIIAHGVNPSVYFPAQDLEGLRREMGLSNLRSIGIFGRVRPQKGIGEFVGGLCRILDKYPEFNAVIVGETTPKFLPFQERMKSEIAKCGLEKRFQWLGKVEFSKIPKLFRCMSLVACLPHNEGFGLTCLEAMASGVPVIATQTGGFELAVRPGVDGEIIPCADEDAFVEKLGLMLSNPEKLGEMGKSARERVLNSFTIQREASEINAVYKKLLAMP